MIEEIKGVLTNFRLNWYDINFILIFIGFSLFTSLSEQSSVLYRAVALGVSLICLLKKQRDCLFEKGDYYKFFIVILSLFMFRAVIGLYFGEYSDPYYSGGRNMAMMFGFGVMLLPMLVAVKGYNEINYNKVLWIILILLSFMLLKAIVFSSIEDNTGRFSLNERQSTLALGDNGAYLSVLSACLLVKIRNFSVYRLSSVLIVVCVMSFLIGILAALKAGSRGPVLSLFIGLFYICSTLDMRKVILIIAFVFFLFFSFNINVFIDNFASVFFSRMSATVENGDMNGRDVIFDLALQKIFDNPILGDSPIIVGRDAFIGYHNYYLTIGVGLGIFGFVSIIVYVISLLFVSYVNRFVIRTPFHLFILSMFWVIALRGITGINPFSHGVANTTLAFTSIILWHIKASHSSNIK